MPKLTAHFIFYVIVVLAMFLVTPTTCVIRRIQRFHSREITAHLGDTVKMQWKYDVDAEKRKEEFTVFFCGYRLKGTVK